MAAHRGLFVLLVAAGVVALVTARPYAGSWNDGSRLATVESLVDRHTLAIDESVFVQPPAQGPAAYPPADPLLRQGTFDKLFIEGHFYSDKPPVPAYAMAGVYLAYRLVGGPSARDRPDWFAWLITVSVCGTAYLAAIAAVYALGLTLGLSRGWALALAASVAGASVAPVYAQHVNNHLPLFAVTAGIWLVLAHLRPAPERPASWPLLVALGTLAGWAYTLDLGTAPPLILCLFALLLVAYRRVGPLAVVALASFPWFLTQLLLNHAIGGVWKPMNTVPEYSAWPGCPFNPSNMTGHLNHGPLQFIEYSAALLLGKHGFLLYNLPLLLAVWAALTVRLGRDDNERRLVRFSLISAGGVWLMYGVFSNNFSGVCASIRWFVPLLAPGAYLLALTLRDYPQWRRDFLILTAWGTLIAVTACVRGPWQRLPLYVLGPLVGLAFAHLLAAHRGWFHGAVGREGRRQPV